MQGRITSVAGSIKDAAALAATIGWGDEVVTAGRTRTGAAPLPLPTDDIDELRQRMSGQMERLHVQGTLGKGGMGVVHLAEQASLKRQVAVKTLDKNAASAAASLLREARITGTLEHPNIVPVYDVDVDESGNPRVILKRIDGLEWRDLIDDSDEVRKRFDESDALAWHLEVLEQVMNAVRFAHNKGVLHLDIKPGNVMIGEFGEVYLLDWGIAVSLDDSGKYHIPDEIESAAGTPAYMAPEMIAGSELDVRTDVYLLGATLYEIITGGTPPHQGAKADEVVGSILKSKPGFPVNTPPGLRSICARALSKRPEDRFESVEAMVAALKDYARHSDSERLAGAANKRLGSLTTAIEESAARQRVYHLFGECRFGFKAALDTWPGNEAATAGLNRAISTMIDYELVRGKPHAAHNLLSELRDPDPDLVERVETEVQKEEERQRTLGVLAQDYDIRIGRNTRRLGIAIFGGLSTLLPLAIVALGRQPYLFQTYRRQVVLAAILLLMVFAVLGTFRRAMLGTAINRRVGVTAILAVGSMFVVELGGWLAGMPATAVPLWFFPLWFVVGAMLTICVERRLWPVPLGYLMGYFVAAAYPSTYYYCVAGANFFMTVTMTLYAFGPPCEDLDEDEEASR
jgi:serine/threonine-protein kinase